MSPDTTGAASAIQVRTPAQLVELVPYLLGFHPVESVVLVGLRGPALVVTARVDIAAGEPATAHTLQAVRREAETVLLVAYTEQPLPRWLSQPPAGLADALHVRDRRWSSLLCTNPDCCPPDGQPLPSNPSQVAVQAVAAGLAPLPTRAELEASLTPGPVTAQATRRAAHLTNASVRDTAWLDLEHRTDQPPQLRALADGYAATARHCPQDATAAAPWFLYAWARWRAGDGTRAAIGIERALAADPHYSAARLLQTALTQGINPRGLPAITALQSAVVAALDTAGLAYTLDEDSITCAGCDIALNHATGHPEIWQVETDADPHRVAEALADVHVPPLSAGSLS